MQAVHGTARKAPTSRAGRPHGSFCQDNAAHVVIANCGAGHCNYRVWRSVDAGHRWTDATATAGGQPLDPSRPDDLWALQAPMSFTSDGAVWYSGYSIIELAPPLAVSVHGSVPQGIALNIRQQAGIVYDLPTDWAALDASS